MVGHYDSFSNFIAKFTWVSLIFIPSIFCFDTFHYISANVSIPSNSLILPQYVVFPDNVARFTEYDSNLHILIDSKYKCFQILTGNYLTGDSCNLPSYCSSISFKILSTSWVWGTTAGYCQGLSQTFRIIQKRTAANDSLPEELSFGDKWWSARRIELNKITVRNWEFKPLIDSTHYWLLQNNVTGKYMIAPNYVVQQADMVYHKRNGGKLDISIIRAHPFFGSDGAACRQYYHSSRMATLNMVPTNIENIHNHYPFPYYARADEYSYLLGYGQINKLYNTTRFLIDPHTSYSFQFYSNFSSGFQTHAESPYETVSCYSNSQSNSVFKVVYTYMTGVVTHALQAIGNLILVLLEDLLAYFHVLIADLNCNWRFTEFIIITTLFIVYIRNFYIGLFLSSLVFSMIGFERQPFHEVVKGPITALSQTNYKNTLYTNNAVYSNLSIPYYNLELSLEIESDDWH